jgi:hypothetical protein
MSVIERGVLDQRPEGPGCPTQTDGVKNMAGSRTPEQDHIKGSVTAQMWALPRCNISQAGAKNCSPSSGDQFHFSSGRMGGRVGDDVARMC